MSSPIYNNFLMDRTYGMFTASGRTVQTERLFFELMIVLRTESLLTVEPVFFYISFIQRLKSPIEFLKKKKGRKRRILYIPKPVSRRRQAQAPVRFLESSFKNVQEFVPLPVLQVLFTTISDFFLKDVDFYKQYKNDLLKDIVTSRINRRRRWK